MYRRAIGVGLGLMLVAAPARAGAQDLIRLQQPVAPPIITRTPVLQDSLDRISRGSALWRDALELIRRAGRRALVLTPDQLAVTADGGAAPFDARVLAEVAPVPYAGSRVDVVLVVVNVPLLEEIHARRNSLRGELEADLDRILAHEVYGHALPYLLAGDLSGRCPDPQPGQRADTACAIQRENAVRAELRLGRRTDAGLGGLSLAWRH